MDGRLTEYLRVRIVTHRESPEVIASGMRLESLEYAVCAKTIYNLIDRGMVPGVSNESLWEKRKRRKSRNRMIRRFIPKGCDISKYTCKQIQAIEDWLNNYPRKILDFETAEERFIQEWAA